jgi:hypothetical protein
MRTDAFMSMSTPGPQKLKARNASQCRNPHGNLISHGFPGSSYAVAHLGTQQLPARQGKTDCSAQAAEGVLLRRLYQVATDTQ